MLLQDIQSLGNFLFFLFLLKTAKNEKRKKIKAFEHFGTLFRANIDVLVFVVAFVLFVFLSLFFNWFLFCLVFIYLLSIVTANFVSKCSHNIFVLSTTKMLS